MSSPEERPLCKCHGEPRLWRTDKRKAKGGYWACRVRLNGAGARYDRTEKGRERKRRYDRSEKGRMRTQRYVDSPKGIATARYRRYRERLKYRAEASAKDRAAIEELSKELLALCALQPGRSPAGSLSSRVVPRMPLIKRALGLDSV